ncbi:MAG: sulfatase-like hydrolase/transferase, partial [Pseudomonadota bacterium]
MNILQIMSDQHQADAMGVAGHAQAITPNLDRLAKSGLRCTQAYTNNPVCTPTRVSVLSGRYCHNHGYFALGGPTPSQDLPDFLSHLREHGYSTAAVGKLHLPRDPHPWLANRVDYHAECCNDDSPENPYVQWARSQGLGDQIDYGEIPELPGKQQNEARPSTLDYGQTVEGFTNELAKRFIDGCEDRPWAMQVSYFRPHQCYTPSKQFWDLYDDSLDLPYGWKDYDTSGRTPDFTEFVKRWRDRPGLIEPTDPESRFRRVWRGYLACISMVDHAVGELLDHLDKRGIADRTAVMYHSDHGAYSGVYGLPEKAPGIASDQVCRIPMIWRIPGITKPGSTTNKFIEQVDIAPTFTSLANVPPMPDPDGFDVTSILSGEDLTLRNAA